MVTRWTSACVSPDDFGGFVAYGDYRQLEALVAQQAAVIEQMREAMKEAVAESDQMLCDNSGHNCEENYSRCNSSVRRALGKALALQPCPEVLNKVRADAVREVINSIKGHAHSEVTRKALDFADLIENGEA